MKSSNIPEISFIDWLNSNKKNCNACCLSEIVMYVDLHRLVSKALLNLTGPFPVSCKLLPQLIFGTLFWNAGNLAGTEYNEW